MTLKSSGALSLGGGNINEIDPLFSSITGTGLSGSNPILSPDGLYVYAFSPSGTSGYIYTRNTTTGALSSSSTFTLSYNYLFAKISSDGTSLYVVTWPGGSQPAATVYLLQYTRNTTTGALTLSNTINLNVVGAYVTGLWISPDNLNVYVGVDNAIYQYSRNTSNGNLTALSPSSVASSFGGQTVISDLISSDGTSIYMCSNSQIQPFSRNTTTGQLTALTVTSIAYSSFALTISPNGKFIYVGNAATNLIYIYSRNSTTGLLTSVGSTSTFSIAQSIAVSPDNSYLYIASSNYLSQYKINYDGTLTSLSDINVSVQMRNLIFSSNGLFLYSGSSSGNYLYYATWSAASWGSISYEVGNSPTQQISMNDASVRSLANVFSGVISIPTNFYGKSFINPPIVKDYVSGTILTNGYKVNYVSTNNTITKNGIFSLYFNSNDPNINIPIYKTISTLTSTTITWEGWVYFPVTVSGYPGYYYPFTLSNSATHSATQWISTYMDNTNTFVMGIITNSGSTSTGLGTKVLTLNTWHHIAIQASGSGGTYNTFSSWFDGVPLISNQTITNAISGINTVMVGGYSGYPNMFIGNLSEVRLSNVARYTPGSSFTPPTSAFTVDANTLALVKSV